MKKYSRLLRESYYFNRLDCGLPIFYLPRAGFNKTSAVVAVRYGSIDLSFRLPSQKDPQTTPAGIAHFLEHLLFQKSEGSIMKEFARYGSYYNASTGHTATSYFFICTTNFRENLDLLLKLIFVPYFSGELVDKERAIIKQELKMYLDIPESRIVHNLLNSLYHQHPVRLEVAGTLESIKEVTPQMLHQCHTIFYQPSNMVMVLTGKIDYPNILSHIENYLSSKPNTTSVGIQRAEIIEPPEVKTSKSEMEMTVARPRLLIGFKERNLSLAGETLIHQIIQTEILLECLFGKGTQLYHQWYNEGLIDDSFSFSYSCHKTYGMTLIGGETDQPDLLVEKVLKTLRQPPRSQLKRRDIDRLKKKYLGRFVRLFDSPLDISNTLIYYYLNDLELFDTPKYITRISMRDLEKRLVEHLDERYCSISIIRPKSRPDEVSLSSK